MGDEVGQEIGGKVRFLVLGGGKNEILFVPLYPKLGSKSAGKSKSVAECQCMRREKRLLEALQVKWQ